ncbi:MAG: restriction endonuclease subunit S [Candidatus Nitrotoga sp.]|nr:restriction endonuclease subunit S [Candidatus Nitrotoga sp.]
MEDVRFELPNSWVTVKLGDFVENEKGKKPKSESKVETASHTIPYVDIQAFEEKVIRSWTDGSGCRLCYETDFLMVWDGSRSGLVGKGMNGALGSTLVRIYFPSMVNDYAFYFLQSKYQQINTRAKGVGIPHVDPALLWNYDFPIAPLNEQHRIVTKIEELFSELDKGIENLKTARAQLKVYRQALLKHAFEGKLTAAWREQNRDQLETAAALQKRIQQERAERYQQQLADRQTNGGNKPKAPKPLPPLTKEELAELPELPEGWGWVRVGEIADVQLGRQRSPDNRSNKFPTKYIRAGNLTDNGLNLDDVLDMEFEPQDRARFLLKAGDVLLSEASGSAHQVGKPAVWRGEIEECCFQNTVIRVRSLDELSEYLFWIFKTYYISGVFSKLSGGVGINHLSAGKLESMAIPLFAISESEKILGLINEKLSLIENLDLTLTTSLQQAEALHQSILKRAFSGQLVPQDPHDEPASVLLARIKTERDAQSAKPKLLKATRKSL